MSNYASAWTWNTYNAETHKSVPKDAVVVNLTADPKYTVDLIRRFTRDYGGGAVLNCIADQIEAQTKPPRIPEPGLWGVVEAQFDPSASGSTRRLAGRERWVRVGDEGWRSANDGYRLLWDDLIDPVLIRPGV